MPCVTRARFPQGRRVFVGPSPGKTASRGTRGELGPALQNKNGARRAPLPATGASDPGLTLHGGNALEGVRGQSKLAGINLAILPVFVLGWAERRLGQKRTPAGFLQPAIFAPQLRSIGRRPPKDHLLAGWRGRRLCLAHNKKPLAWPAVFLGGCGVGYFKGMGRGASTPPSL